MGQGTMHGDVLEFRPHGASKDTPAVEFTTDGFEGKDYWSFGGRWLPYRGRVYTLNFEAEDLRHPTYLGFIDAQNAEQLICDFTADEHETLRPAASKHAGLCRRVARGAVSYIPAKNKDEDEIFPTERAGTALKARVTADFRNLGQPQPLALLGFEFSGGRGCNLDYFDLLADGALASSGDAHDMLAKLQKLDFSDRSPYVGPSCGGNNPRWFTYAGKTYFDNVSRGAEFRGGPFHEVKLVQGTQIEAVCTGIFSVTWRVKTIGPKFR